MDATPSRAPLFAGFAAAIAMLAVAPLWGFVWLLGTNGYSSDRGGAILVVQAAAALLAVPAAGGIAHAVARRHADWGRAVAFVVGCVAGVALAFGGLCVVALATVGLVGTHP